MCIHLLCKYSRSNTTTIEKQRLSVLLASDNTTYLYIGTYTLPCTYYHLRTHYQLRTHWHDMNRC